MLLFFITVKLVIERMMGSHNVALTWITSK